MLSNRHTYLDQVNCTLQTDYSNAKESQNNKRTQQSAIQIHVNVKKAFGISNERNSHKQQKCQPKLKTLTTINGKKYIDRNPCLQVLFKHPTLLSLLNVYSFHRFHQH